MASSRSPCRRDSGTTWPTDGTWSAPEPATSEGCGEVQWCR